jgi:hypothetical protein
VILFVIPALRRLRQEDFQFERQPGLYSKTLFKKKKKKEKKKEAVLLYAYICVFILKASQICDLWSLVSLNL